MDRATNLGPTWPPLPVMAKSMCIRVTSGGRMTAPGPYFMLASCDTLCERELWT